MDVISCCQNLGHLSQSKAGSEPWLHVLNLQRQRVCVPRRRKYCVFETCCKGPGRLKHVRESRSSGLAKPKCSYAMQHKRLTHQKKQNTRMDWILIFANHNRDVIQGDHPSTCSTPLCDFVIRSRTWHCTIQRILAIFAPSMTAWAQESTIENGAATVDLCVKVSLLNRSATRFGGCLSYRDLAKACAERIIVADAFAGYALNAKHAAGQQAALTKYPKQG